MAELDAWGPLAGFLSRLNDSDLALAVVSSAGLTLSRALTKDEAYSHKTRVRAILDITAKSYAELDEKQRRLFVANAARELYARNPGWAGVLNGPLGYIGYQVVDGVLIQVGAVDTQDLAQVPEVARPDLLKAAERIGHDPSGAVTSACAAIDAITAQVYMAQGLGNPCDASFQERVNRSLEALGAVTAYDDDLVQLGWDAQKAKQLAQNLKGSINQAANVMQTLRSGMGDVHGTKKTLEHLVFESLKWAVVISTMFKGAGVK
jgi:hypothetical protein